MNLYIYMAKLNKEGIKVISSFPFVHKVHPTKVGDIRSLNLTPEMTQKVTKEFKENKMHYDLYVETAENFESLKKALAKRGYSHLPIGQFTEYSSQGRLNKNAVMTNDKTMLRSRSTKR